jgi:hypothetical protein
LALRKLIGEVIAIRMLVLVFDQVFITRLVTSFAILLICWTTFTAKFAEATSFTPASDSSTAYGTYELFPQGSSRAMGLGGAYTSLSDDVSGIVYNPAGLAFGKWRVDAGGTTNRVDNREADVNGDGSGYPSAYNFVLYGVALRLGDWVIATGVSSPYEADQDANSSSTKVQITSIDALLAKRFGENFSAGVTGHAQTLKENYNDVSGAQLEESSGQITYTAGAAYRTKDFGFGGTYTPGTRFKIDSTKNASIQNHSTFPYSTSTVFFRDGVIPTKTTFGGFYYFTERFMITVDVDSYDAVKNSLYTGSGSNGSSKSFWFDESSHTLIHGGFEWKLVESKQSTLIWRAGGYQEPRRIVNYGKPREHLTLGVEVRFGPAVLGVAFDQATDFNNTAQGFSISFGAI